MDTAMSTNLIHYPTMDTTDMDMVMDMVMDMATDMVTDMDMDMVTDITESTSVRLMLSHNTDIMVTTDMATDTDMDMVITDTATDMESTTHHTHTDTVTMVSTNVRLSHLTMDMVITVTMD